MSMVLWMVGFSTVLNLHDSSTITAISEVDHMLNSAIWKGHCVFAFYVSSPITSPLFAEVSVILIIMHTVLKVKGIWVLVISTMTSMSDCTIRSRVTKYLN